MTKTLFILSALLLLSSCATSAKEKRHPAQANIGTFKHIMGHGVEEQYSKRFSEVAKYAADKQYQEGVRYPIKSLILKENCQIPDLTKSGETAIYQVIYEISYYNGPTEYIMVTMTSGEEGIDIKSLSLESFRKLCK